LLAGKASAQRRPRTTTPAGRAKVRKRYSLEESYDLVIPNRLIGEVTMAENSNGTTTESLLTKN
jgi:hypothetical protein